MARIKEHSPSYAVKKNSSSHGTTLRPKQAVLKMLRILKEDATYEDIMYELYVLEKIERGLSELDKGKGIPHEEVKKSLSKWLK